MTAIHFFLILSIFFITVTIAKDLSESDNNFDSALTNETQTTIKHVEKRGKRYYWRSWSEWSNCSQACDGGVAFQTRECRKPGRCQGETIQYMICNMQPCVEVQNLRVRQCSRFDDIPYDGALFKWTPHYDYSKPCALTCRGRPAHLSNENPDTEALNWDDEPSVIVQLVKQVEDGTRCRPGSLNMCIKGKCQRVGCDFKLGSSKTVDSCGVCGGDGGSCLQPLEES